MVKPRIVGLALAIGLAGAIPGVAMAGTSEEQKLDESIKVAEARLMQRPNDAYLKVWLDHARDYKSGERTDHPGDPPK